MIGDGVGVGVDITIDDDMDGGAVEVVVGGIMVVVAMLSVGMTVTVGVWVKGTEETSVVVAVSITMGMIMFIVELISMIILTGAVAEGSTATAVTDAEVTTVCPLTSSSVNTSINKPMYLHCPFILNSSMLCWIPVSCTAKQFQSDIR